MEMINRSSPTYYVNIRYITSDVLQQLRAIMAENVDRSVEDVAAQLQEVVNSGILSTFLNYYFYFNSLKCFFNYILQFCAHILKLTNDYEGNYIFYFLNSMESQLNIRVSHSICCKALLSALYLSWSIYMRRKRITTRSGTFRMQPLSAWVSLHSRARRPLLFYNKDIIWVKWILTS